MVAIVSAGERQEGIWLWVGGLVWWDGVVGWCFAMGRSEWEVRWIVVWEVSVVGGGAE